MPHRRIDTNPDGPERRRAYRREEDDEVHTIADTAGDGLKFIHLVRNKFFALVVGVVLGGLVTQTARAIGPRVVGANQEIEATNAKVAVNAAHIATIDKTLDSLTSVLSKMQENVAMATRLGCLNSPRSVASAAGCP